METDSDQERLAGPQDEFDTRLREWRRAEDTREATWCILLALQQGLMFMQLPWHRYPGVHLLWLPARPGGAHAHTRHTIHLSRAPGGWRLAEVRMEGFTDTVYGRFWQYRRPDLTVLLDELASWDGDPQSQPHRYFLNHEDHCDL